ncbi:MAG: hypothetical protein MAGBODY4_00985 [Candidatus Marinimicrobia bacterium]|nr:hypothetical protein [Candidatus Neomarinimicrobiota bacterium]
MKKSVLILAVLMLTSLQFTYAQEEKATPPPTRLEMPEDTTVTAETTQKVELQKPELELPEVLVLGAERNIEVTGEKQSIVPESPSLVKPDAPSEFVSTWFRRQAQKPSISRDVYNVGEYAWSRLDVGNGIAVRGNAGYWRRLPNGTLTGQGWGEYDAGDYENNSRTNGGLRAQSYFEFGEGLSAELTGEMQGERFGLYQILDSSATRNTAQGILRTQIQFDHPDEGKTQFVIGLQGLAMQSDTAETQYHETSNRTLNVRGKYSNALKEIPFSFTAAILRDNLSNSTISDPLVNTLNRVGLESRFTFSNAWTSTFGLQYETFSNDSVNTLHRFSPWGKLNYIPVNYLGFSLSVTTGYQYQPFSERVQDNKYIDHRVLPRPDRLRFGSRFALDLQLTNSIALQGKLRYSNYQVMQYWMRNATGLFVLVSESDVEIIKVRIGANMQVTGWLQLIPSLEAYTVNYGDDNLQDIDYIPYNSRMEMPVIAEIDLGSLGQGGVELRYVGVRQTTVSGSGELDPYLDINGEFQRTLNEQFTVFIRGENLLNRQYSHWQGIPANGLRILLGAKATF